MDRRAFLEGLCASVAAAGVTSPGNAEVSALAGTRFPVSIRKFTEPHNHRCQYRARRLPAIGAFGSIRPMQA